MREPNSTQPTILAQGGATERWRDALERLRPAVTPEEFETWLAPVACRRLDAGGVELAAPTEFFRRWIEHNFAERIAEAARAVLGSAEAPELLVTVGEDLDAPPAGGAGCRIIAACS